MSNASPISQSIVVVSVEGTLTATDADGTYTYVAADGARYDRESNQGYLRGDAEINDLAIGGPMSVAAWVRIDDLSNRWSRIFDFSDGEADNNIFLTHNNTSNTLEFKIYNGQGGSADASVSVSNFFTEEGGSSSGFIIYIHDSTLYAGAYSSTSGWSGAFLSTDISSLDTSHFHQITLFLDEPDGTLIAWLDGAQIGQSTSAQSVVEHSGQIDGLRIYDRAFTNSEVQAMLNSNGELSDSFIYMVSDQGCASKTAEIDITVQRPINAAPNAEGGVLNVGAGQTVAVNSLVSTGLLGNDQDAEGNALSVTRIGETNVSSSGTTPIQGQYGTLIVAANGTYSYTPSNAATPGGIDTFTYTVSDGTSTATATLTVNMLADSFAANDSVSIVEKFCPDGMSYLITSGTTLATIDVETREVTTLGNITGTTPSTSLGHLYLAMVDGQLYALGEDAVYTVDPHTLAATEVATRSISASPSALTDNPSPLFVQDGQLYGVNGSNELISINKNTGAVTNLGTSSDLNYPADLAYSFDSVVEGNVLSNDTNAQSVTSILDVNGNAVTVTSGGTTVQTEFGEINIKSDGSYSYTLNNTNEQVDSLTSGQTANDRFVYTTVDNNGDTAQAVLTVHINGADEVAVVENRLEGDETNNILIGGLKNDSINAGGGKDTLTGGGGIDFFIWHDGDQGASGSPAVDIVTDFNVGVQGGLILQIFSPIRQLVTLINTIHSLPVMARQLVSAHLRAAPSFSRYFHYY
ncbi:VCBS domain-containing protein [Sansalvadorimonas sp. 2012CJ34-2]|uniref:VCBS domain-containing protein n=1 Tax=Parendozoicomonas callyspongiae TaxID=2942213 RepID=A0ABT0PCA5_9GAMM|nr:VCBS domain-containing protein [Sansalvadorimonas sp. 2012CJ34-2]MCL6268387.1 VCBS domain-containing protein [Sansalvadorimonas sp. 2012CJ34-2]